MLTTKKIILALVAVTLTCLVPTLAFGAGFSTVRPRKWRLQCWLFRQRQYGLSGCANARWKPRFHRVAMGREIPRS